MVRAQGLGLNPRRWRFSKIVSDDESRINRSWCDSGPAKPANGNMSNQYQVTMTYRARLSSSSTLLSNSLNRYKAFREFTSAISSLL